MAADRVHDSGWDRRSPSPRRPVAALALWVLAITVTYAYFMPDHDDGLRGPIADSLNTVIAWSDLNLGLSPRLGAQRAVELDPALRTSLGRQGARWLAGHGSLSQQLRWAGALAQRDPSGRPLLQRAANAARCANDPRLRATARTALKRAGLPVPRRPPC